MSHHDHEPFPQDYPQQHAYDRVLLKTGPLWASLIGLVTLIVFSMGLMRAFQLALTPDRPLVQPKDINPDFQLPAGIAPLNPEQVSQRESYLARQKQLLSEYGWVSEKQKVARIPIDLAMSLVAKKYEKKE
ncbi:hypothetical protein [Planctomicrobium piriforme]|uniref:Uncharacterized protein n=1 Tax=Planctomicrobium piriforme TaxID=1576369 RepID=A0A1I3JFK3_9PLAN|nr:hypothetical protein [Planctomicrobium piriforme]SFI58936.1 hypothetical protein SAMN05421753_110158 [Planctomicrobium piriforme]